MTDNLQNSIRYHINHFIYDNGFAPTVDELARLLQTENRAIEQGLKALADNHALVLHPNSFKIWVAHPYALFPTLFWVETPDKHWWGNCAWCSLGIAACANTDTKIHTKLYGEQKPILINITAGKIQETDYVVHFPIPGSKFWDNVLYTCANTLVFKNESEITDWCRRHNMPKGEILSIEKVWELSKLWYGDYLDPNFQVKTKEKANAIFTHCKLTSDFWQR